MSKHPLDHDRKPSTKRAQVYTDPSRAEGLHPATQALHKRPRGTGASRLKEFVRAERESA